MPPALAHALFVLEVFERNCKTVKNLADFARHLAISEILHISLGRRNRSLRKVQWDAQAAN